MLSKWTGRGVILGVTLMASAAQAEVAGGVIGCDASGNKQIAGAVIGGVLGGVVGNNVIKKDQQAGTIVGAATGAAAGSYVGCKMQKSDAARAPAAAPARAERSAVQPTYVDDLYSDDTDRYDDDDDRYERREYRRVEGPAYGGRGMPPGLARKPYGMPPGRAKKLYAVGERMPVTFISDRRNFIYEPSRYRLRPPPAGYRWVIYGEDAYLVRTDTGLISRVVRALLG